MTIMAIRSATANSTKQNSGPGKSKHALQISATPENQSFVEETPFGGPHCWVTLHEYIWGCLQIGDPEMSGFRM